MGNPIAHAFAVDEAGRPVALQDHQVGGNNDNSGLQYISAEHAQQLQGRQVNQDYVDENWGTAGKAAAGLASGLSLGLAPSIASRMGLLDRGHLEAAEQSGAFTAGDLAGTVAPALLSGGESLAARGAAQGGARGLGKVALALTPAGLMSEAGGLAEHLAGSFLPNAGLLGKGAATTVKMAARGATEGAIINLSHEVSDNVIQNKPLAAQALLAAAENGALFGGLTGGLLGGAHAVASSGIDMLGGRVASLGGRGSQEVAAAKALKYMGATDADLARMAGGQDGLVGAVRGYSGVIDGADIGQGVSHIHATAKASEVGYRATANETLEELQKSFPTNVPRVSRVEARISNDIQAKFAGQLDERVATRIGSQLNKDIENIGARGAKPAFVEPHMSIQEPVAPKWDHSGDWNAHELALAKYEKFELPAYKKAKADHALAVKAAKEEHAALPAFSRDNNGKWSDWANSRTQLAERVAGADGVAKDVYATALNAFDDELRIAMSDADKSLATKWGSAEVGRQQAESLANMTAKKAAAPPKSVLHLDNSDAATMGFSVFTGADPIVGMGILAGKKIVQHVAGKLEAPMAEAAYRSAIGAQAGAAQATMGRRISSSMKSFLGGARVAAEARTPSSKPSYTMGGYQKALELADEMTSAAHQAKVREQCEALSRMGHPELAQEMAMTYGRAVAYVNQNKPKGRTKEHAAGSLGKLPKAMGLGTQEMKFMRQVHAMTKPLDAIVGGIERGDLSRDAVATIKYVFPDVHQDIVTRAAQEVMSLKEAGKFVPADKLAALGTVLDYPVDSKLTKDFVNEVQQGLAANKAPPPNGNTPPSPNTDVSSYQTPLQSSVG